MDATTRSVAVLAAAALLVVPLVNALVLEAQETADRQVTDPPDRRPPETEASPTDRGNTSRELPDQRKGASLGGNCTPVPEDAPAASWHHPDPADAPGAAAQTRSQDPADRGFRVSDLHPAVGVGLQVEDLSGSVEAQVHPAGSPDDAAVSFDVGGGFPSDVDRNATIARSGALATGDWTAQLDWSSAAYRELQFTVVRALCQEAAP